MALELATIGAKLSYAVGTGTTRPTSAYTIIPDIKEMPGIELTPNQIDVTTLVDHYRRYIPGVKDAGSDMAFTANLTDALKSAWTAAVSAANSAYTAGNLTWFEISIPNFDSFYFAGLPSEQGFNGASVDSAFESTLHIIPNQIVGWATAST